MPYPRLRSLIATSRVVPCAHVRPHTVSADDTVVGYSEQTPLEAPLGKPEGVFHDSIPGENGVRLCFRAEFLIHLSQPALSLQIRTLEENAGVRLFERNRRKTTLTAAGVAFRHEDLRENLTVMDASQVGMSTSLRLDVLVFRERQVP